MRKLQQFITWLMALVSRRQNEKAPESVSYRTIRIQSPDFEFTRTARVVPGEQEESEWSGNDW